jgi:hypothetical protein
MKKCPKCKSDVESNFDTCWNCQYHFNDATESAALITVCPNCEKEFKTYIDYLDHEDKCPKNNYVDFPKDNPELQGTKKVDCLRCNVQLDYQGNFKFHEGTRIGALGDLFELFTNRESFDLYSCPNCGKIEFSLPGFD